MPELVAADIFDGARVWRDDTPAAQPYVGFTAYDGRYVFGLLDPPISFELDHVRRDRNQHLTGELTVCCEIRGAHSVAGVLSVAAFNASQLSARIERAKLLTERARTTTLDWFGYLEEFCQRIFTAERQGQPARLLASLDPPVGTEDLRVEQDWCLLRQHPVILFGDGGSAKSYLALYAAGRLAHQQRRVLFCDWELAGDTHRARLGRLFGDDMPAIWYLRCERPLVYEIERIKRLVQDLTIDYVVMDSVAFASAGPPEDAEVAAAYFRAVRQLGPIGSLHVAHVSKADDGDKKPFGSSFWHNSARATWHCGAEEFTLGGRRVVVTLTPRKANLSERSAPLCVQLRFVAGATEVCWLPYLAPEQDVTTAVSSRRRR